MAKFDGNAQGVIIGGCFHFFRYDAAGFLFAIIKCARKSLIKKIELFIFGANVSFKKSAWYPD